MRASSTYRFIIRILYILWFILKHLDTSSSTRITHIIASTAAFQMFQPVSIVVNAILKCSYCRPGLHSHLCHSHSNIPFRKRCACSSFTALPSCCDSVCAMSPYWYWTLIYMLISPHIGLNLLAVKWFDVAPQQELHSFDTSRFYNPELRILVMLNV